MNVTKSEIDKIGLELHEVARAYANRAATLASDPYFRQAVMKVSVSGFVWALYHAFDDEVSRASLDQELKTQSAAIERALSNPDGMKH